jgi:hypothetical protein
MNNCVLLPNGQIIIVHGARVSNANAGLPKFHTMQNALRVHRLQQ